MRRPLSSKRRRVVRGIVMGAESALCRDPMGERREDGSNVMVAQPDFVHCPMKMRTCTRREKSAETNKCGSATASSPYPTIARCTVPLEVTMRSWLAEDKMCPLVPSYPPDGIQETCAMCERVVELQKR
jgi:hypothetical protein